MLAKMAANITIVGGLVSVSKTALAKARRAPMRAVPGTRVGPPGEDGAEAEIEQEQPGREVQRAFVRQHEPGQPGKAEHGDAGIEPVAHGDPAAGRQPGPPPERQGRRMHSRLIGPTGAATASPKPMPFKNSHNVIAPASLVRFD